MTTHEFLRKGMPVFLASASIALPACGGDQQTEAGVGDHIPKPPEQLTPEHAEKVVKSVQEGLVAYGDGMRVEHYKVNLPLQGVIQRCLSDGVLKEILVTRQELQGASELTLRQRLISPNNQKLCSNDGKITEAEWNDYIKSKQQQKPGSPQGSPAATKS